MKTPFQATLLIAALTVATAAHGQLRKITENPPVPQPHPSTAQEANRAAVPKGAGSPGAYAAQASGNLNKTLGKALPKDPVSAVGQINPRYQNALYAALNASWKRPANSLGSRCQITIKQLHDGSVEATRIGTPCDFDMDARRALKEAVVKASPLPMRGFEKDWKQTVEILFVPGATK